MIRINDEIKKEVSEILRSELKDPRITSLMSVLKAETTQDLKYCKIHVSILGNEEEIKETMKVLKGAKGYIRSLLAHRINLRLTPELIFIHDDALGYGIHIEKIINSLNLGDKEEDEDDSDRENNDGKERE